MEGRIFISLLKFKSKFFVIIFRTKTKWTLKTLESCERTNSDVLRLNFDTIKKDKKERTYKVEKGLCQVRVTFHDIVQSIFNINFCAETGTIFTQHFVETSTVRDESNALSMRKLCNAVLSRKD